MKHLFFILTLLSASATAGVNDATVNCLKSTNYSQQNFNTFNFYKAAKCQQEYVVGVIDKQDAEYVALIKDKPYYGGDGSGWYKGVDVYSTR